MSLFQGKQINKEIWYINCFRCEISWRQDFKGQFKKCPACGLKVFDK
jgi:DNA-directed RNA polymerase subunit RPC12/RpoP